MKNFIVGLLLIASMQLLGQETKPSKTKYSGFDVGFQLNEFSKDFGLGITVSSPRLLRESVQFRLRANTMYFEYVVNNETNWEPYYNLMLGSSSSTARISKNVGLFGEGGVILVFPSNKLSSSEAELGGYGIFGFEFYFTDGFTYFIEMGGIGIDAVADRVANRPIYSNGFLKSVGFKIKL